MINDQPNEDLVIAEIVERLKTRFPDSPASAIREAVDQAQQHFARARVKDFVPLFIEREAKARLERPIA
ncbi:three-helix bundle dimerization domain-containing protein [Microbacterium sp.]|uniref:three-helix bundle dimerization domain-containing protein n=1 Tax=Microbacterium sp. TaxID=51671 RepID=UPI0025F34C38|nr:hypothetical protein [Microbacterium sp.]MBT9605462.1 hypothetical protein [Microbacterium sp.]